MEILKKMLNSFITIFIAEVAIGLLLLINPDIFTSTISYVLGGVSLAFGVLNLISYFCSERIESDILKAVLLCAAGIFIITKPDFIFKILAFIFGIYLLGDGITSIKRAMIIKDNNIDNWIAPMVMAVLTTILGLLIILNPFASAKFALKVLGVSLIVSGAFSIYNGVVTKRKIKRIEQENGYVDIK
ncbi:MAG: HdeD family acid-resistance protein [Oscillospiraceae bacterium]